MKLATGLMWEVKTTAGDLRDMGHRYSWYNSSGVNDGGDAGLSNAGGPGGTPFCVNNTECDTEKYVAAVNAAGLCGYTDWRLPDEEDLRSIVDFSVPASGPTRNIEADYFPNTFPGFYWSSSSSAGDGSKAWIINFNSGANQPVNKSSDNKVRLVRGGL